MKFLEVVLIFTLWLEIEEVFAIFETCDNDISATNAQLRSGFYLNSPNFPNARYPSGSSCRFHVKVQRGYEMTLSCQITMEDCKTDRFYVAIDGSKTLQNSPSYCGQQNIQIQLNSLFNELTFGHISSADSLSAGYYSCFVKPKKQKACDCGWSVSAGARIVGGSEASPNEFISMVGIQKTGDPFNRVFAGGTLIHFRYILTAAHAVLDVNPSSILALVGYHDLSSNPDTQYSRKYGIESIIINENYNPTNNVFNYDIALLRTNEDVQYNYGVGPACLPVDTNKFKLANKQVTVAGWGSTSFGGPAATRLQKVNLQVIGEKRCLALASNNNVDLSLNAFKLCTEANPKDSCQGDSGGGLYYSLNGRSYVVGVISFGFTCGASQVPSVSTSLKSQLLYWITSNIQERGFICRI